MSGGVDSSVASAAVARGGLIASKGLFMKNWEEDDGTEYCTAKADLADAASGSADQLGHPAAQLPTFAAEYWDGVFAHFLKEYEAGRTPKPRHLV